MAADSSPAMLAYWDTNLLCRYANDAYKRWFGRQPGESFIGMALQDLVGEAFSTFQPHINAVMNGGTRSFELAWASPGSRQIKRALVNLIPDFAGDTVQGFMVNATDVTPGRHKVRTDGAHVVGGDNVAATEIAIASADELSALIHCHICNASQTSEVNLYDTIVKAVRAVEGKVAAVNASVRVKVSPFIYVEANPDYIYNVISGFIRNALERGHEARPLVIELSTMVVRDETVLSVKDNGKGVDVKKYRGTIPGLMGGDYKVKSNDLALYIASQQVYAMGGFIGVESSPAGAWFRIYFKTQPVRQPAAV